MKRSIKEFFVEKVFLLDFEGVLGNSHQAYLNTINEGYNQKFELEDITEWEFGRVRKKLEEIHPPHVNYRFFKQFMDITNSIFDYGWESIPPTEDNLGSKLQKIIDLGYSYDIVTSRDKVESIEKWLSHHSVPVPGDLRYEDPKKSYKVNVDDNPNFKFGKDELLILYNRPWNQGVKKKNIVHINGFNDLYNMLISSDM